jgi:hypothetical protein
MRVGLRIEGTYQTRTCLDLNYLTVTGTVTATPLDGSPEQSTTATLSVPGTPGPGGSTASTLRLGSGQVGSVTARFADDAGAARNQCTADDGTGMTGTGGFAPTAPGSPAVPNVTSSPPVAGQLPLITASGPLKTAEGKYVSGDTNLFAATEVGPRVDSGAVSMTLSVRVDGVTKASAQRTCNTIDCTTTVPFTFHPGDYSTGNHVVSVVAADATGQATSSWTVTVDPSVATQLACTDEGQSVNFTVYSLGPSFKGLPRVGTDRDCPPTGPSPAEAAAGMKRPNLVAVYYGDCDDYGADGSCQLPLEIQTWPACERNRASYQFTPEGDPLPRQDTTIRGVPAAWYDDGRRLELYTGAVTIVIFGRDQWQMEQAALAVAPTPANPFTNPDPQTHVPDPTATLPAPVAGALAGRVGC